MTRYLDAIVFEGNQEFDAAFALGSTGSLLPEVMKTAPREERTSRFSGLHRLYENSPPSLSPPYLDEVISSLIKERPKNPEGQTEPTPHSNSFVVWRGYTTGLERFLVGAGIPMPAKDFRQVIFALLYRES